MTTKQAVGIGAGLTLAALAYSLAVYDQLPPRVPSHWNGRGQIDGYSSRAVAAVALPATMALFVLFQRLLPALSPLPFAVDGFRDTFHYVLVLTTGLFGVMHVALLRAALSSSGGGEAPEISRGFFVLLWLFFALLGNVLGRTRRNFYLGIRTPWTLASDLVWQQTHRLAGRLLVGRAFAPRWQPRSAPRLVWAWFCWERRCCGRPRTRFCCTSV